jgi:hypothetical protein
VSRFETEILAQDENIDALSSLNSGWVSKAVSLSKTKKVILDIDSSESPVQETRKARPTTASLNRPAIIPSSGMIRNGHLV